MERSSWLRVYESWSIKIHSSACVLIDRSLWTTTRTKICNREDQMARICLQKTSAPSKYKSDSVWKRFRFWVDLGLVIALYIGGWLTGGETKQSRRVYRSSLIDKYCLKITENSEFGDEHEVEKSQHTSTLLFFNKKRRWRGQKEGSWLDDLIVLRGHTLWCSYNPFSIG